MKDDRLLEMRVFKAVVDAGGFTAAAHVLGVAQSFVSQTINNLERRLGLRLLHRSTRGRRLTAEGEQFLELSTSVINGIDLGESRILSDRSQPKGDLRVSAPIAFGMDQIVPRLSPFLKMHPEIRVQLSLSDLLVNLIEENIDVAIRMGRLHDSSLVSRKLCNLQRVVVASPDYLAANGAPATPQDLTRHNCLMWQGPQDHLNRWPFLIGDEIHHVVAHGNFSSSNGLTLFELCTEGVGIMRCAEHLALPAIRAGRLAPLLLDYQGDDDTAIHLVVLPEREPVPRIRAFVQYLTDFFRNPPWAA